MQCNNGWPNGLTRLMGALLFGVTPTDPLTYGTVSVVLLGATMLASYLPARRAAGIDPVQALKSEQGYLLIKPYSQYRRVRNLHESLERRSVGQTSPW